MSPNLAHLVPTNAADPNTKITAALGQKFRDPPYGNSKSIFVPFIAPKMGFPAKPPNATTKYATPIFMPVSAGFGNRSTIMGTGSTTRPPDRKLWRIAMAVNDGVSGREG